MSFLFLVEKAGKGRSCPFWHNQNKPAAKRLSNPCESNREAARSHAQVTSMASGVDWLVSGGHPTTGVSPSDSPLFRLDKRWGVHRLHLIDELVAEDTVTIAQQIARCSFPG